MEFAGHTPYAGGCGRPLLVMGAGVAGLRDHAYHWWVVEAWSWDPLPEAADNYLLRTTISYKHTVDPPWAWDTERVFYHQSLWVIEVVCSLCSCPKCSEMYSYEELATLRPRVSTDRSQIPF